MGKKTDITKKNKKFNWTHNIGLEVIEANADKIMCHISSECEPNL